MDKQLDEIIGRAGHLCQYGNATHIPELAGMVKALAMVIKDMKVNVSKPIIRRFETNIDSNGHAVRKEITQ